MPGRVHPPSLLRPVLNLPRLGPGTVDGFYGLALLQQSNDVFAKGHVGGDRVAFGVLPDPQGHAGNVYGVGFFPGDWFWIGCFGVVGHRGLSPGFVC